MSEASRSRGPGRDTAVKVGANLALWKNHLLACLGLGLTTRNRMTLGVDKGFASL